MRNRASAGGRTRWRALALATLLLVSAFAPITAAASSTSTASLGTTSAATDSMTVVPADQIRDDIPASVAGEIPNASAFEGEIKVSKHADTTRVTVTTMSQARGEPQDTDAPKPVLQISDASNHEGRDVALPVGLFERRFGYVPSTVTVYHESGDTTTAPLRLEGTEAVFNVGEFSTNTIEFSGVAKIDASNASDGSSYQYDISDLDAADNYSINLTGKMNTESETLNRSGLDDGSSVGLDVAGNASPQSETVTLTGESSTAGRSQSANTLGPSGSHSLDVGGNREPVGPSGSGDPEITLTGNGYESESASVSGSGSGSTSQSLSVDGNVDPSGPSGSGEPQLSITGYRETDELNSSAINPYSNPSPHIHDNSPGYVDDVKITLDSGYESMSIHDLRVYVDGTQVDQIEPLVSGQETFTIPINSDVSDNVTVDILDGHSGEMDFKSVVRSPPPQTVSVSSDDGASASFGNLSQGETVSRSLDLSTDASSITIDSATAAPFDYELEWTETQRALNPSISVNGQTTTWPTLKTGESATKQVDLSTGSQTLDVQTDGGSVDLDAAWTDRTQTEDPVVSVAGTSISHDGYLADGETVSQSVDLSTGSQAIDVQTVGGTVGVSAQWTERTQTVDPGVEVNGNPVEYFGTLADGETASLATDTNWLQSGTNRVNVTIGDGTLSSDAPAPKVDLLYRHRSLDDQEVNFTAERWSERYNISRTFGDSSSDAQVSIPFKNTVYDIRNVDVRKGGGSWSDLPQSDYSLDGTTLSADLGTVSAGETVDVRATGSRFSVRNASVSVLEPTPAGQRLDSRIEVGSWASDSYIQVPTSPDDWHRVHYLYNSSWQANERAQIDASGAQKLKMPYATTGDTTTVATLPVEAKPKTGDAAIQVINSSGSEPAFRVLPGEGGAGDEVEFTLINAPDQSEWSLYSRTHEIVRDSGTASSPLTLSDDDSQEVLVFLQEESGATSSGGNDLVGQATGVVRESAENNPWATVAVVGIALLLLLGWWWNTNTRLRPKGGLVGTATSFLSNRTVLIGVAVIGSIVAVQYNVVFAPPQLQVGLGLLLGVVGAYWALKRLSIYSPLTMGAVLAVALIVAISLFAPGALGTLLGSDTAQRALLIATIGAIYLAYQAVQAWRKGQKTVVRIDPRRAN